MRSLNVMTIAAACVVLAGCGRAPRYSDAPAPAREVTIPKPPETQSAEDRGATLGEVESLPKDFSVEYTAHTAGVLPRDEEFIRVQPDGSGGFLLTVGEVMYEDGSRSYVPYVKQKRTGEQCLKFYNAARKAGFFALRDSYEEMEDGGIGTRVTITANGSTKKVFVYGTQVEEFDRVVAGIKALAR